MSRKKSFVESVVVLGTRELSLSPCSLAELGRKPLVPPAVWGRGAARPGYSSPAEALS